MYEKLFADSKQSLETKHQFSSSSQATIMNYHQIQYSVQQLKDSTLLHSVNVDQIIFIYIRIKMFHRSYHLKKKNTDL